MNKIYRRYLLVVLLVGGALSAGHAMWKQTVKIGCLPHDGVAPPHAWLAECGSDRIGDFTHDAVWFDTQPSLNAAIQSAKVLFFGDSRMLLAVSHSSAPKWFESRHVPFYILAFTFGEQSGWARRLLARFKPHPAIMVFDTDPYFTDGQSEPAEAIDKDPQKEWRFTLQTEQFIQDAKTYCRFIDVLCGRTRSTYRDASDGHVFENEPERFWFATRKPADAPITRPPPPDRSAFPTYLANARKLIDENGIDPSCVVFTIVPNGDYDASLATYLAQQLGANVVAPHIDGLETMDRFHLSLKSSELWMSAFLTQFQPIMHRCIGAETAG